MLDRTIQRLIELSERHRIVSVVCHDGEWRCNVNVGSHVVGISKGRDLVEVIDKAWEKTNGTSEPV